ncbi:MAG: hypothetical protein FWK04_29935 [Nostoc sp. GBBB01]|nr:hypothetical protein [Nostoc sp. GBBB01]
MKKIIGLVAIAVLGLTLTVYFFFSNTYVVDCTQAKKFPEISYRNPSRQTAEIIANRYITEAVCFNKLKSDSSSLRPYFFSASDLSKKYQTIGYTSPGFRSPESLKVKFDNGTLLNFCFSLMVINCDRALECSCPYDFNWEPKPK